MPTHDEVQASGLLCQALVHLVAYVGDGCDTGYVCSTPNLIDRILDRLNSIAEFRVLAGV